MKRLILVLVVFAVAGLSVPGFADTTQKLQGGIRDVMTSPLQVSDSVKSETTNAKFLPFALVGGLLKGTFYMAKQIVTGSMDVVTSPLDMMHVSCPLDK